MIDLIIWDGESKLGQQLSELITHGFFIFKNGFKLNGNFKGKEKMMEYRKILLSYTNIKPPNKDIKLNQESKLVLLEKILNDEVLSHIKSSLTNKVINILV